MLCDVEVMVMFDRVLGVRSVRELYAVELSNERAEFSWMFMVEVKMKVLVWVLGKVGM